MLIVIDMQPSFPAMEFAIDSVVKEVKKAVRRNEWVMLVEYEEEGRTAYRITKHLKGHHKTVKVVKQFDDGSPEIFKRIARQYDRLNWKSIGRVKSFKVCGVNTGVCVFETVQGLNKIDARIKVLSHACASYCCSCEKSNCSKHRQHHYSLSQMSTWKNVEVT